MKGTGKKKKKRECTRQVERIWLDGELIQGGKEDDLTLHSKKDP